MALRWSRAGSAVAGTVDLLCELADVAICLSRAHDAGPPGHGHAARERARDHDDAVQMQARALRLMGADAKNGFDPHALPGLGRLADR